MEVRAEQCDSCRHPFDATPPSTTVGRCEQKSCRIAQYDAGLLRGRNEFLSDVGLERLYRPGYYSSGSFLLS